MWYIEHQANTFFFILGNDDVIQDITILEIFSLGFYNRKFCILN
jgi:hypothetical protein